MQISIDVDLHRTNYCNTTIIGEYTIYAMYVLNCLSISCVCLKPRTKSRQGRQKTL